MSKTLKTVAKTDTTVDMNNLPTLPPEITSQQWYQNSVNNTNLKNVGGDNWKITLFECLDPKTGTYNKELVKVKVTILEKFGKRPPSTDGIGTNGEDFSDNMKDTKRDVITLISERTNSDGCFVGKSGKLYQIQNPFFREYVLVNGKPRMLTTIKKGTKYIDHNGKTVTK
tara:strand:- start:17 stop:526 length:510 start_codon:yes stop_codon:yes gene_type:complete